MKHNTVLQQLSLSEMLQRHTVAELRFFFKQLSLKIKSGLRKDMMVKCVSQWILAHPDIVMTHLFTYELRMYDDIINHQEKEPWIPGSLDRMPFDDIVYSEDEGVKFYIAPDLAEKLRPLLADEIARREQSCEETIENSIIGLLNLRGAIPYEEYMDILEPIIQKDDSKGSIAYRFNRFVVGNDYNDELAVESPYIPGTDFNIFDARRVDSNVEPKRFTTEEIAKAGMMPYPQIGGASRSALKKQLFELGHSETGAENFLLNRWLEKQNDEINPLQVIDTFKYDSFEQAQATLMLMTEYANNMPYWRFKGWSSAQMAAETLKRTPGGMPHIVMGPNMRARGITSFEQLQEMAIRGEEIPDAPLAPTTKVGRNDPCPCGSGKKYKHCCGR